MAADTRIAGRFEVVSVAGSGGMGTVYRAKDLVTGGDVAVKMLRGAGLMQPERFEREARLLADLRHPGIVRYVAHGAAADGTPYLVMEWLEGGDLSSRLAEKPLTLPQSVELARKVAEALGKAHSLGVVHRDVKPRNIFLVDGQVTSVKLLDFGIARGGGPTLTLTGTMLGTPGYSAPEQVRGAKSIDARADVFALGCVIFRCLTGRAAFSGSDSLAVLAKVLFDDAPRLNEILPLVPVELSDLVARMLAKDRAERPSDAAKVAGDLEGIERSLGASSPTQSRSMAPPVLTARERRLVSMVVACRGLEPSSDVTMPDVSASASSSEAQGHSPGTASAGKSTLGNTSRLTPSALRILRSRLSPLGARVHIIGGDSLAATIRGKAGPADQAVRAARCALALQETLPTWSVGLATRPAELRGGAAPGDAIDTATRLVRAAAASRGQEPGRVRLDETTAGFLALRFELSREDVGFALIEERRAVDPTRTLLGKAAPCVGRDRELHLLLDLYRDSVEHSVGLGVVVTGGPGMGKSRLGYELVSRLSSGGGSPQIWVARGDPMAAPSAFGVLGQLILGAAGISRGEPLAVRRSKLAARLASRFEGPNLARITDFIGELVQVPASDEPSTAVRTARRDIALMGEELRRAWEDFLDAERSLGPVVILLEDLQWADASTTSYIDAALAPALEKPLLVVALARPDLESVFPKLWAERSITRIALTPLSAKAAERLAREVLESRATDDAVTRIVRQAEGNPAFLEELIRKFAEGGDASVPQTMLAMVQARLESLEPDARRVLRAASVFGQVFWTEGVHALLSGAGDAPLADAWLAELTARELVAPHSGPQIAGQRAHVFRQGIVREAAYSMLTDADRTLGHRLAGEWLERMGETDAMLLAEHFERGGQTARAAGSYATATAQALRANDFRGAIERADRAAACGATDAAEGALRLIQAEAHNWIGEFQEAERRSLDAMRCLPQSEEPWYLAAGELANASGRLGNLDRLGELVASLRALPPEEKTLTARIVVLCRLATRLFLLGKMELGRPLLEEAERAIAGSRPDARVAIGNVYASQAIRASVEGDLGGHIEGTRAAGSCFEAAGNLRDACTQRVNQGFGLNEIGSYSEAEAVLRGAAAEAERLRLPHHLAGAHHNLAFTLARTGKLEEARCLAQSIIDQLHAQRDLRIEAVTRIYLSIILEAMGKHEEARAEVLRVIEGAPPGLPIVPYAYAVLARALAGLGDPSGSLHAAMEGVRILETLSGTENGEALLRLAYAEALFATGDRGSAREAILLGRERLLARARRVKDEDWRQSLLANVPEHARTLELAAAWQ
jgi:serine/threonine protein kinase/tetratricopeptide (TPR) repeat protein